GTHPTFSLLTSHFSRSTNLNAPPRFEPTAKTSHDLGWRVSFLQTMDRTLARNHGWQSGLCHLSGDSRAVPRNSDRTIQTIGRIHRARWGSVLCCRSRVSLVAISIFEEMAGVGLRSCPWFRTDFRGCLQVHRAASQSRINLYSIALGQGRAAADLFLGAALVSPSAWSR